MYIMSDTERACRGTPIATERTFSILKVKCIPHLSELYNRPTGCRGDAYSRSFAVVVKVHPPESLDQGGAL